MAQLVNANTTLMNTMTDERLDEQSVVEKLVCARIKLSIIWL